MTDLAESLARMLDWFAGSFKNQKKQSKSLQRSQNEFAEMLDDLSTRRNLTEDDLFEINDGVSEITSGIQELAYIRGINDGMKLASIMQAGRLPETVLKLLDDLAGEKSGGDCYFCNSKLD